MHTSIIRRARVINSGIGGLAPASVAAVNNTALDGFNTAQATSVNLSTIHGLCLIGCVVTINTPAGFSAISSPNIGSFTKQADTGGTGISFWTAVAPATPLLNEAITATVTSQSFIEMVVFGVTGVKTGVNGGLDSNGLLPFVAASGAASIATSSANDFLLSMFRDGGVSGHDTGNGWSAICDNTTTPASGFTLVQFKKVSVAGTYTGIDPSGGAGGVIGHALVST